MLCRSWVVALVLSGASAGPGRAAQEPCAQPASVGGAGRQRSAVVSLLFGIARQQHPVDLSASPLAFYPRYASLHSPDRDAITLENLLTMSSGLEWQIRHTVDDVFRRIVGVLRG